jgi:protocatechuate 3,4-dioxygenase beta subunit
LPDGEGYFDVPAGAVVEIDEYDWFDGMGRIEGEVRDREGRPVAGAVVTYPEYGFIDMKSIQPAWSNTTATDDDGRFELLVARGWTRAGFRVAVARSGFAAQRTKPFFGRPQPGETERVDFTLEPAATLRGRVVDALANPVRHAHVEATQREDFRFKESTHTAHDGTFLLTRLPPGPYTIRVWADDVAPLELEATTGEEEVVIALPGSCAIAGVVVAADGEPARDCLVAAISASGRHETITTASGRFCLAGLAPGTYDVQLHDDAPVRDVPTGTDDLVLRPRR